MKRREGRAVTRGVEPCPRRGGIALSNRKRRGEELRNNSSPLEGGVVGPFLEQSDAERRPFAVRKRFTYKQTKRKVPFTDTKRKWLE